jgi:hypothetical protein
VTFSHGQNLRVAWMILPTFRESRWSRIRVQDRRLRSRRNAPFTALVHTPYSACSRSTPDRSHLPRPYDGGRHSIHRKTPAVASRRTLADNTGTPRRLPESCFYNMGILEENRPAPGRFPLIPQVLGRKLPVGSTLSKSQMARSTTLRQMPSPYTRHVIWR